MHPNKKEGITGHNEKLRRMTRDYGAADPAMNKASPDAKYKQEGGEEAVGFGADSAAPKARSDRPARKSVAANPVATYADGGSVISRARGGKTRKKGGTHVNVIVAPGGGAGAGATPPPVMPPPGPPPGAPPMAGMPPGGLPPGGPPGMPPRPLMAPPAGPPTGGPLVPPRARGGKVGHADEKQDRKMVKEMVKSDALKHRASGGRVHMEAGAASGEGRLEKEALQRRSGKHKAGEVTG